MRHLLLNVFYALLAAAMLTGCDVHQFPEQEEPPLPATRERVTLRLHFYPDFWVWEHLYDPKTGDSEELYPNTGVDEEHPGTSSVYTNVPSSGLMEVFVKVYSTGNTNNSVAECHFTRDVTEGYDCDVELELPQGSYEVVVWSHLLENAEAAPFYGITASSFVYIIDENYKGNTDYRDGFSGRTTFSFAPSETSGEEMRCYDVEMRRPMGKFEFVTTDLSEFLDRETERRALSTRARAEDYRIVISYPYYYPNAYNATTDDTASGSGYRFETVMTVTGDSEASLGFDYVFIRNILNGAVQAQITVYDLYGNHVASSQVMMVPIRRDHHTVFRGAFLTTNSGGGVGIDPGYEGDHNLTFP